MLALKQEKVPHETKSSAVNFYPFGSMASSVIYTARKRLDLIYFCDSGRLHKILKHFKNWKTAKHSVTSPVHTFNITLQDCDFYEVLVDEGEAGKKL